MRNRLARLASMSSYLNADLAAGAKLVYKNQHQHRRARHFRKHKQVAPEFVARLGLTRR